MKSTTEKDQVNPGHIRSNFRIDIFEWKMCVSESVWLKDSQNVIFISEMFVDAQNRSLRKWRHQLIRFLDYMFAKSGYINCKFGMLDAHAWFHNILCFFEKFLFKKSCIKIGYFLGGKFFFEKNAIAILKNLFSTPFNIFICILLLILF